MSARKVPSLFNHCMGNVTPSSEGADKYGANEGTRTPNFWLGKTALYH